MEKKFMTKAVAALLAFIMTFTNVILLGIYTNESIAAGNIETQEKSVTNAKIEFDAYFEEEGEYKHTKIVDMDQNSDKLFLSIKVTDGYLSNGKIQLKDTNFNLAETEEDFETIQSIDVKTNTVTLNQINKGESVVLELPIKMKTDSNFDIQNLDKVSSVELSGKYVNTNGKDDRLCRRSCIPPLRGESRW